MTTYLLRRFPTDVPRRFTDAEVEAAALYWHTECHDMPLRVVDPSMPKGEGPGLYAEVKPLLDAVARLRSADVD